jgi:acetyltransferase-like isoleucine patch superfamily enzyme
MMAAMSQALVPPPEFVRLSRWRAALTAALEPAVRLAGWLAVLAGRQADAVEMRLRGRILGGTAGWRVGRDVAFVGPLERIRLGPLVTLYGRAYLNASGPESAGISIGKHSHVDQFCVLYGQGGLIIGSECAIASGTIIYSQTNSDSKGGRRPVTLQPTIYQQVEIGDGCWLGAGVRVLPGVRIASGVHIGAGAVVSSSIEAEYAVAVGVPAREVKRRPV